MAQILLLVLPLALAGCFTWAAVARGTRRLWRDGVVLALSVLAFALLVPYLQVVPGGANGFGAAGYQTIYFPIGVLAPAVVAWLLVRRPVPAWAGRPLSVVIGALSSYLATMTGFWIS